MGVNYIDGSNAFQSMLTGVDRTNSEDALNVAAADAKLWLKVFSGEVLNAYDHYNVFEPLVHHRTIPNGTTVRFPITGSVGLKPKWGAGEELAGGGGPSTSREITLDDRPMAAHFELDNPDLMITQWEYRSEMARQVGMTLANTSDKQIAVLLSRAGAKLAGNGFDFQRIGVTRADADATGGYSTEGAYMEGGQVFTGDGKATGNGGDGSTAAADRSFDYANLGLTGGGKAARTNAALGLLEDIEHFFVALQKINAPTEGVCCAVTPQAFADIRALNIARASGDFNNGGGHPFFGGSATDMGGLGAPLTVGMHGQDDFLMYQGCKIIKTNHMPSDYTSASIGDTRYNVNGSTVKALIWQPDAVARLTLQGMKVDSVEDVRRNTHFTVASTFKGGDTLRSECAGVCMTNA